MLQFQQAEKSYGENRILFIPALDLANGVYWLQGANGCGKTTLLRMIAGLLPFKGDIRVHGISLHQKPLAYRRQLGWAEAEPLYPAFITGHELISFYQHIRKAAVGEVEHLIRHFGMRPYLSAPVGSYSAGMVKRLSLLLAFLGKPALVLLDEPLATLDAEMIALLPELISGYHSENGTGFIFSSHQAFKTGSLPVDRRLTIVDHTIHPDA